MKACSWDSLDHGWIHMPKKRTKHEREKLLSKMGNKFEKMGDWKGNFEGQTLDGLQSLYENGASGR